MLGVNDRYVENVKHTLKLLEKYGINVAIHSILTQKNSTEEDFKSIFDFIKNLSNILYWKPDIGSESVYVNTAIHGTIAPTSKAQTSISVLCNKLQRNVSFPILSSGLEKKRETPPLKLGQILMKEVSALAIIFNCLYCQIVMLPFVKNYIGIQGLLLVIF